MELVLIVCGGLAILMLVLWLHGLIDKGHKYDDLRPRLDNLDNAEKEFAVKDAKLAERETNIVTLARQKATGFPWLANAYAEYFHLEEMELAHALEKKKHPAFTAAEKVREAALRRREAERIARIFKYQIEYYENLFPWLVDLKSEDIEEELVRIRTASSSDDNTEDPAKQWLTSEEYSRLPSAVKYQTALDRYWSKKKSRWEVGRDFERYVGWRYESQGSSVRYQGIIDGFDDLGRDLIVSKGNSVGIVQCKYWSKEKTIHEKHIFQLYGTVVAYKIDHPGIKVQGHFVTSTTLSERARQFAKCLGIKCTESLRLAPYPCIKCNISRRPGGERIYHLPFDQQYDTTVIEADRGEFYASTVAEAEAKGFRRAFRYHSE